MRSLLLAAAVVAAFAATMTVDNPDANAATYCGPGAVRAGCFARAAVRYPATSFRRSYYGSTNNAGMWSGS